MTCFAVNWRCAHKRLLFGACVLLLLLPLGACSDSATRQKADQSKSNLDQLLRNAQQIGVPQDQLLTIINQETKLSHTSAPFMLFSNQTRTYYQNLDQRYQDLTIQVRGLEYQSTQQLDYQANLDLQNFENLLAKRQSQGFSGTQVFANQLTQNQQLLARARFPKDYLQISTNARNAIQALNMMGTAYDNLGTLQQNIDQSAASGLDTTALELQIQNDLDTLRTADSPEAYTRLLDMIGSQEQESRVISTRALPYIGETRLQLLNTKILQGLSYGLDVSTYQQHLTAERQSLSHARSLDDYLKISAQADNDLAAIQLPLLQGQAGALLKQYNQAVRRWGSSHQYLNPNDQTSYQLDYEYGQAGAAASADSMVQSARTKDDYQAAITFIQNETENLHAMEAEYNDQTSANRPHATDLHLLSYYKVTGTIIVVSLLEQYMRVYQDGQLLKAIPVTTGQYQRPTPPGSWQIFDRESPTIFKSAEPKGSAFWYPNTPINFALGFHDGGYFIHDSSWRQDYGLHTNFPHTDSGGDQIFAGNGSHGCINVAVTDADWIYQHTTYGTAVIVY